MILFSLNLQNQRWGEVILSRFFFSSKGKKFRLHSFSISKRVESQYSLYTMHAITSIKYTFIITRHYFLWVHTKSGHYPILSSQLFIGLHLMFTLMNLQKNNCMVMERIRCLLDIRMGAIYNAINPSITAAQNSSLTIFAFLLLYLISSV